MNVHSIRIDKSEVIKYLGAYLDATLSMKTHTTNKCRMAMLNQLKIKHIRKMKDTNYRCLQDIGTRFSHITS